MTRIPGTTFHDDDTPTFLEITIQRAELAERLAVDALRIIEASLETCDLFVDGKLDSCGAPAVWVVEDYDGRHYTCSNNEHVEYRLELGLTRMKPYAISQRELLARSTARSLLAQYQSQNVKDSENNVT